MLRARPAIFGAIAIAFLAGCRAVPAPERLIDGDELATQLGRELQLTIVPAPPPDLIPRVSNLRSTYVSASAPGRERLFVVDFETPAATAQIFGGEKSRRPLPGVTVIACRNVVLFYEPAPGGTDRGRLVTHKVRLAGC